MSPFLLLLTLNGLHFYSSKAGLATTVHWLFATNTNMPFLFDTATHTFTSLQTLQKSLSSILSALSEAIDGGWKRLDDVKFYFIPWRS